ncbi:acyl carrier protein [Streptomyces sirii]|uniref:acyl carrier protein n=1 Tax=Streptomyces sirii TaxID=3127701 RepID=UPI003D36B5F4
MQDLRDAMTDVLTTRLGVDPATLRPNATLMQMGVDSVSLVELKVAVQRILGVRLNLQTLSFEDTLEELTRKIADFIDQKEPHLQ